MDLALLRKALNLGDDVSDADVIAKVVAFLQEREKKAAGAEEKVEEMKAQLSRLGLSMDGNKIIKLAKTSLSLDPVDGEDPEKAEMRAALAKARGESGTNQVKAASLAVESAIKDGKIPKALQEHFTKLASIGAEAPLLALSSDGKLIQEKFSDALKSVKTILNGLPTLTGDQLEQLEAVKPEDQAGGTTGDADNKGKMKPEALTTIAQRSMTKGERQELAARKE